MSLDLFICCKSLFHCSLSNRLRQNLSGYWLLGSRFDSRGYFFLHWLLGSNYWGGLFDCWLGSSYGLRLLGDSCSLLDLESLLFLSNFSLKSILFSLLLLGLLKSHRVNLINLVLIKFSLSWDVLSGLLHYGTTFRSV